MHINSNQKKGLLGKGQMLAVGLVLAVGLGMGLVLHNMIFAASANSKQSSAQSAKNLPIMTANQLSAYDGTDPKKPIYLGFEGNVYDVTAGKEYYVPGGTYHFLAGKDSTAELHIAGGDIIKTKYPIVARLAQ